MISCRPVSFSRRTLHHGASKFDIYQVTCGIWVWERLTDEKAFKILRAVKFAFNETWALRKPNFSGNILQSRRSSLKIPHMEPNLPAAEGKNLGPMQYRYRLALLYSLLLLHETVRFGKHVPSLRRNLKVEGRGSTEKFRRVISQNSVIGYWKNAFLESKHNLSLLKMNHYEIISRINAPGCSKIIETDFHRLKRDISILCIFLLLCLCILIVVYVLLCVFCFDRAN